MTKAALLVVLVLGCGTVTADPKDGAAGSGGGQAAVGGAGGELGGQVGTGGADPDAGLATTGPCAGLCSNPAASTLTPHVPIIMTDRPGGACYAVSISTAGYSPQVFCSPGPEGVEINGRPLSGCTSASSAEGDPDADCIVFLPSAPSTGTVTIQ